MEFWEIQEDFYNFKFNYFFRQNKKVDESLIIKYHIISIKVLNRLSIDLIYITKKCT